MILLWGNLIAVLILGLIVLLGGRDERLGWSRPARWLMIAGFVLMGLQASVYLLFALGEMAGGDLSGAGHLLPAATIGLLGFLSLKRPLEAGIALLILGLLTLGFYGRSALLITWPLPLSGALLFTGAVIAHKVARLETGQNR